MDRTDTFTNYPMEIDGKPVVESHTVQLQGTPEEVGLLIMSLKTVRRNIQLNADVSGTNYDKALETVERLLSQVETPADVTTVTLPPDSLTEDVMVELTKRHS